jgi:PhnB protein
MANDAERSQQMIDQLELAIEKMLRGERATMADAQLAALMGVASDLRDLPRESFLARLGQELGEEGERMLATENQVREGYKTVTPYIVSKQIAALADFLKNGLGAEETFRSDQTGSGGGYHYEFRLGHSMLMAGGSANYPGPEITPSLHYFVADVDGAYRRAIDAGATSLHVPVNQPYGVREASINFAGVDWYLSTPMKDEQGRETLGVGDLAAYLHPKGADEYIAFLGRAFGAETVELFREPAGTGPIVHAKLRLQDSILELGEAHGEYQPKPTMLFLYVPDADAAFQRAVNAGATVTTPMGDQPYGRTGAVSDPQGNLWHVCTPPAPK